MARRRWRRWQDVIGSFEREREREREREGDRDLDNGARSIACEVGGGEGGSE